MGEERDPAWRRHHRPHVLLLILLLLLATTVSRASAQSSQQQPQPQPDANMTVSFRPSIAIVIGIFSIMFCLTFLLLMYAKFCHVAGGGVGFYGAPTGFQFHDFEGTAATEDAAGTGSRFSGIDKTVIESLPFFRFSSLRGVREGLECAVCLSRFEGSEVLRLLPRCKHAFHIDCVDRWLEAHSSCPLCRSRVRLEDVTLFKYSTSSRFLFRNGNGNSNTDEEDLEMQLELYVEREPDEDGYDGGGEDDQQRKQAGSSSSLRFGSIGESFRKHLDALKLGIAGGGSRKVKTMNKGERPPLLRSNAQVEVEDGVVHQPQGQGQQALPLQEHGVMHKFRHRIIVSDVVFKNRWSDLNSADLTSLNSEMLSTMSSGRFNPPLAVLTERPKAATGSEKENSSSKVIHSAVLSIKEEMERKRTLESKAGEMIGGTAAASGSSSRPPVSKNSPDPHDSGIITSSPLIISEKQKCMSEITDVPRRSALRTSGPGYGSSYAAHVDMTAGADTSKEEKVRRVWLPIARRTVKWLAGREERRSSQQQQHVPDL